VNAQPGIVAAAMNLLSRYAALLLFALAATLFPAKEAKAESAIDVLLKVCEQVGDNVCGPIESVKTLSKDCFTKGADDLACAVAILNVATGGGAKEGINQVNAVISCIKAVPDLTNKAKFDATCRPLLQAAGVNVGKIDEVYGIASKCGNADDVDDFIYCADTLIDSSFVEDADLNIPSWVDSLFEIYIDIDQKDYWGLVYHVGATVVCAVANYFTGNDVCALLSDLYEIGKDVVDGAKKVGGAINNEGEKLLQDAHEPILDFFNRYWLPDVDNYAKAVVVQKNIGYWSANVGEKFKHCRNYFDSHRMSEDKASRACSDMRDGTAASDNAFIDKGFSQLASRRGAVLLLPPLVKAAAETRIVQMRAQGAFKSPTLLGTQVQYDPWKSAAEVPGVTAAVYKAYGLGAGGNTEDAPLKRDAKAANEAWRAKTVGFGAYLIADAAKVAPATLDHATSANIATKAITASEAGVDIAGEVKAFVQTAQAGRMKMIEQIAGINKNLQESRDKPLNDTLAMCAPKATAVCEAEVRARFKVCDEKAKAFYDANAAAIGDFDSQRGKNAIKQWSDIRATCEAAVLAYVNSLPNVAGDAAGTASCKQFLGRSTELLCTDTATFNACKKQVDTGKLKTCRLADTTEAYPPSTIVKSCSLFLGRTTELLCPNASAYEACKVMVDGGQMKTCRLANTTEAYPKGTASPATPAATPPAVAPPAVTPAVAPACKPFLGRADEMLCPDAATFAACKTQVDGGKMKTCRQEGNTAVYSKPASLSGGSSLTGGSASIGGGLKPGGPSLAPPAPKVDEAALKTCKGFLGRKDEMLCNDPRSFAACKMAVDIGQMKTCRMTGSTDVYSKR